MMPRSEAVASQATSKPEAKSGEMKEETRALPEYPVGRWVSQDNPRARAATMRTAMAAMSLRTGREGDGWMWSSDTPHWSGGRGQADDVVAGGVRPGKRFVPR